MNDTSLADKYKTVLETINAYPKQFKQAWDEVQALSIPEDYKNIVNISFFGMGGSALGARIADSLLFDRLKVPLEIFTEYKVPSYAYLKTLAVVSSYSGGTEETVEAMENVLEKQCKVFGITTGGTLAKELTARTIPHYTFNPTHNPSGQPRNALGYAFGSLLSLLAKLKLVDITENEVETSLRDFEKLLEEAGDENSLLNKEINRLANSLNNKAPMLVGSEHLVGTVYSIKNQFNESAKTFSAIFELPELNHHLMEGLGHPSDLGDFLTFLFFESDLYTDRVKKRYELTRDVISKNKVNSLTYKLKSTTKLSQVFETLCVGSLVVFTIAKTINIDPTVIPWVDYFKAKLSSMS